MNLLPSNLANKDAIEWGCGTGYVSAWMEPFRAAAFSAQNYQEMFAPETETETRACVPAE